MSKKLLTMLMLSAATTCVLTASATRDSGSANEQRAPTLDDARKRVAAQVEEEMQAERKRFAEAEQRAGEEQLKRQRPSAEMQEEVTFRALEKVQDTFHNALHAIGQRAEDECEQLSRANNEIDDQVRSNKSFEKEEADQIDGLKSEINRLQDQIRKTTEERTNHLKTQQAEHSALQSNQLKREQLESALKSYDENLRGLQALLTKLQEQLNKQLASYAQNAQVRNEAMQNMKMDLAKMLQQFQKTRAAEAKAAEDAREADKSVTEFEEAAKKENAELKAAVAKATTEYKEQAIAALMASLHAHLAETPAVATKDNSASAQQESHKKADI